MKLKCFSEFVCMTDVLGDYSLFQNAANQESYALRTTTTLRMSQDGIMRYKRETEQKEVK